MKVNIDDAVSERLHVFSKKRIPRTTVYKLYADSTLFTDPVSEQKAEAEKWLSVEDLPCELIPVWVKPLYD